MIFLTKCLTKKIKHETGGLIKHSQFSADVVQLPRGQERSSQILHLKTWYTRGSVRVRQSLQVSFGGEAFAETDALSFLGWASH